MKLITIFITLILAIFLISSFFTHRDQKIKVVVCPTYYYLEEILIENNYEVIKTKSSAESFALLKTNSADLILTGRTAKQIEKVPNLDFIVIGEEGYSFLGRESNTINHSQMANLNFVTDLDAEKIKNEFPIKNLRKVADVYDFSDQEIIITNWENTDFEKADIVHVLKNNGERDPLSRRLNIYYLNENENPAKELISLIKPL